MYDVTENDGEPQMGRFALRRAVVTSRPRVNVDCGVLRTLSLGLGLLLPSKARLLAYR